MSCHYRVRCSTYGSEGQGSTAVVPNLQNLGFEGLPHVYSPSPVLTATTSFRQPRSNNNGGSIRRRAQSRSVVERSQSQVTQRAKEKMVETTGNRPRRSCDVPLRPSPTEEPSQLTLVLMGAPMVGKSTLVNQFLWEVFIREYRPTVEEFNWVEYGSEKKPAASPSKNSSKNDESNEKPGGMLLQVIDSSGSRDFLAMRYLYYKIGDAFMVVYSLNDPMSYAEALIMVREIEQRNSKNCPILLVANKSDLEEPAKTIGQNQVIAADRPPPEILPEGVISTKVCAKNLNEVKQAFWKLIEELARRRQLGGRFARRQNGQIEFQLHKRRQSMPSRRTANELGIDSETLERLVRKHDSHSRNNCTIS
ncbi:ras family domain-containing protein [Ditylenchus destructor]|nr:ras family domain-containing protein [Ditylenchus destructor]